MLSSATLTPRRAAQLLMLARIRVLGDVPGHEFHGNQWTDGGLGASLESSVNHHQGVFYSNRATMTDVLEKVRKQHPKAEMKKAARGFYVEVEGKKFGPSGLKTLGDLPGHEFHGNQWTEGHGGEKLTWKHDPDQREFLINAMDNSIKKEPTLRPMYGRLRDTLPGSAVAPQPESKRMISLITKEGRAWTGKDALDAKHLKGQVNQCHANSAKAWLKSPGKYSIVTGYYGNSYEGIWRQHSWLVEKKTGSLVETTPNRATHYFGVPLSDEASKLFAESNSIWRPL